MRLMELSRTKQYHFSVHEAKRDQSIKYSGGVTNFCQLLCAVPWTCCRRRWQSSAGRVGESDGALHATQAHGACQVAHSGQARMHLCVPPMTACLGVQDWRAHAAVLCLDAFGGVGTAWYAKKFEQQKYGIIQDLLILLYNKQAGGWRELSASLSKCPWPP